jgi:DAACS family dicarboxylate/amino acid:cation (Na+ or H+) symporter
MMAAPRAVDEPLIRERNAMTQSSLDPNASTPPPMADEPDIRPWGRPLYVWVLIAVALAVPLGLLLGADASHLEGWPPFARKLAAGLVVILDLLPTLILRAMKALAAPLVVLAILSAIVTNDIHGRQGLRMMGYYLINTILAMIFGLVLANVIRPGQPANLTTTGADVTKRVIGVLAPVAGGGAAKAPAPRSLTDILVEMVPQSIGDAFVQNNLAQLVLLTLALAIGLVQLRDAHRAIGDSRRVQTLIDLITIGFELLMKVLLWVVALVPLAVLGVVATSIGRNGFSLFVDLGWFIVAVLLGLACQVTLYLVEIGVFTHLSPIRFLKGARDVAAGTFSTASTAATMPITLKALTEKLGVSRASSQLAACVGTNFNNDGTALYQAAAALFFAQALGADLTLVDQLVIVLTTLVASVGAGGIPSGSFVTMPLIFAAVNLPPDKLPILLTIDWFLDRCRTTSNVLGDMTVAVLLDRTHDEPATDPTKTDSP